MFTSCYFQFYFYFQQPIDNDSETVAHCPIEIHIYDGKHFTGLSVVRYIVYRREHFNEECKMKKEGVKKRGKRS